MPAEILRDAGFRTFAIWRNGWIRPAFGFSQGFEVYHHRSSAEGKRLARSIHGAFKRSIQDTDRGVKTAGFRVIKRARMPAVLVEVGFMSHRPTERKLATDAYRRRLAEAIADGIERYAGS